MRRQTKPTRPGLSAISSSLLLLPLISGCNSSKCDRPECGEAPFAGLERPTSAESTGISAGDTILLFVHGFGYAGYLKRGAYGEETVGDGTGKNLEALSGLLGMTLGSADPTAPFALSSTDYYGSDAPDYYTDQDKQDITASNREYGGGIPTYALIVAKFARHRLEQSGASQVALFGHSMGGEVTRWIVEHDTEHLVSEGYLNRWIAVSGVIKGAMLDQWIPQILMNTWVSRGKIFPPELAQMDPSWIDDQYGGDGSILDNPLLANVLVTHIRGTLAIDGNLDYYPLFFGNANDTVLATRDMTFDTVTDVSKWTDLSGSPVEPAVLELSQVHMVDYDSWNSMATIAATLVGHRRATIKLESVKVNTLTESSGAGELFIDTTVSSPYWASVKPEASVLEQILGKDRIVAPLTVYAGDTFTVGRRLFDAPIMDQESGLDLTLRGVEADCAPYWGILEDCDSDTPNADLGEATVRLPLKNGTYTLKADSWEATVSVNIRDMW